ncbi:LysR family transcriptional regulator [Kitasatospora sp. NPDC052896]|uniref:LysR family transcriptional regulator n=1 Tax=Kitasatospora sp. NPDC052896 TaxID=3364061 RepID=UPI0037C5906A
MIGGFDGWTRHEPSLESPWLDVYCKDRNRLLRMTQEMDWNLLAALDVLLAEGSVTGAAERLHLSVPATSRTLGRIRKTFGDPILVRAGRGLVPTPRALAIQQRLHRLIEEAHALVEIGRDVDLVSLERTFTIRANDALVGRLAARLVTRVRADAPGVTLRFAPEGDEDLAPLRDGLVDLDLGVIEDLGPEVLVQPVGRERLVGMTAAGHSLATGPVTLERIAAAEHIAVSRRGRTHGALDDILGRNGLARRIVAVVPTFTAAAHIIAGSDMTGLITAGYAAQAAALTGAHVYEIPVDLPSLPVSQAWHVRHDLDPAHQWLRDQVAAVLRE